MWTTNRPRSYLIAIMLLGGGLFNVPPPILLTDSVAARHLALRVKQFFSDWSSEPQRPLILKASTTG